MTVKKVRNILGGFLFGFGWMTMFCFFYIDSRWTSDAPKLANSADGLTYAHNVHGTIVYLSYFQWLSERLLVWGSLVAVVAGFALLPKQLGRTQPTGKMFVPEDNRIAKYATFAGIIFAPAAVYFAGPAIVRMAMSLAALL
ncbi:hypothetical protein [Aestuariivirga sp.]|uniref:hypothetical protein n=1 Tax=Aestuariivirga sp. TaxID=2650926 RepID=UPI0039E6CEEB